MYKKNIDTVLKQKEIKAKTKKTFIHIYALFFLLLLIVGRLVFCSITSYLQKTRDTAQAETLSTRKIKT